MSTTQSIPDECQNLSVQFDSDYPPINESFIEKIYVREIEKNGQRFLHSIRANNLFPENPTFKVPIKQEILFHYFPKTLDLIAIDFERSKPEGIGKLFEHFHNDVLEIYTGI